MLQTTVVYSTFECNCLNTCCTSNSLVNGTGKDITAISEHILVKEVTDQVLGKLELMAYREFLDELLLPKLALEMLRLRRNLSKLELEKLVNEIREKHRPHTSHGHEDCDGSCQTPTYCSNGHEGCDGSCQTPSYCSIAVA